MEKGIRTFNGWERGVSGEIEVQKWLNIQPDVGTDQKRGTK